MTSLTDRKNAAISRGVGMTTQIYAERAENAEIWDKDGNRYIDFAAGIAVVNTGHRHPRVVEAVKAQLDRFTHTCHQVVPYENYVALAERLNRLVPGNGPKKTAFYTTGAEAVENAVKIARHHTGRAGIIAFAGGFHGRTFLGMSLTGKVQPYKAGFGPMMNDIWHLPFPNALHGVTADEALAALDRLFKADIDPSRVAAIIVEPVQGEGGFYEAPPGFMQRLRQICDQYSILLIADEVQTGFARTGKLFAMEHHGVAADLTTMAKGLGGGLPISAVTGRADVMDSPAPGGLGGTYAGNPLAVAAAHAVLDVIEDEGLCERATRLGQRLKQRLAGIAETVPEIVDIRGPGFMNAVEFNTAGSDKPSADFANRVREEALKRNLILLTCGVHGNVIRFLAPLTIQDTVFDEALDILEDSIQAARN
ncbi:4-aminobutyrate--2-oxoglutarate transaminase [Paracoccus denitrificans]|jgi:4-aminobutyrate aminotransferase|uniref:4-aminobutyrate aminotransferase apoenzyme n=1 Tax=Paracoccus denitrificans (strain Pd 1222) TaxID=318586 RepID=A1B4I5_PARDP|nr:4-aminobutyrate--2-oxoglutarate transaminase [Paracoccus denitrificans]ABL70429.1 4-aminobutyrate aminotransferase apoenzyme [Paracoccus denitrificans PD1222]MBB4627339.1 4-aminobutyrate aminotransferase [Paracoccus denitrificans]MCU7427889.1 4-aminobutyrate--2-oxoglutarate transaminase [Paracoccus denitrificans]QAR25770.1 4-aminobutyrate--2-oxoglutarate transaminase [Paracoccus denitrificans]UPV94673.1 4-aminobutyrate--2-oxoglutarate transaminase [Paracoccus denitrificans]